MSDNDDSRAPGANGTEGTGGGDRDDGQAGSSTGAKAAKRGDYEIGYGRPPAAHQFPKGVSGNPRGPKKGSRGLKKDLDRALRASHSIRVDGRVMKGTTQEMALLTLAKRAGTGDVRAIRELIDLTLKIFGTGDRGRERGALSPLDEELLGRMLGRFGSEDEAAGSLDGGAAAGDTGIGGGDGAPAPAGGGGAGPPAPGGTSTGAGGGSDHDKA